MMETLNKIYKKAKTIKDYEQLTQIIPNETLIKLTKILKELNEYIDLEQKQWSLLVHLEEESENRIRKYKPKGETE